MSMVVVLWVLLVLAGLLTARAVVRRLQLSRAKHPGLAGHPRLARLFASLVRAYHLEDEAFFASDGASADVVAGRRRAFEGLAARLSQRSPSTIRLTRKLAEGLSDLQFTSAYRVPVQYSRYVRRHLPGAALVTGTHGPRICDADGNESYDVAGSYGLNVFGTEFYKSCVDAGIAKVCDLGPVLGAYHPIVIENVRRLRDISGLDEVSFHMSGTEAVMQAVRLARYHTGRRRIVRFSGAYHGWWDGVQPGVGNPLPGRDVYTLREMDERTLRVLRTRTDIACVLVNPLQALHPNAAPPSDNTLIAGDHAAGVDRDAYAAWLRQLRRVCSERQIVLIFDEVFVGFRIACGGAQEYFGVAADLVTYGKTVGGGLPVGVLCGRAPLMRRFDDDRPSDICLARGTFSAHPYVMGAMHEFLERLDDPAMRARYESLDSVWNARVRMLNDRLCASDVPVRVANLTSIWCIVYTRPSRYHWMFQYYLRAEGLALSWVGTGRLIFSHDYSDDDFSDVAGRMVRAAVAMKAAGWWSGPAIAARDIKRQVLREIIQARAGITRAGTQAASSVTIGSNISPRST